MNLEKALKQASYKIWEEMTPPLSDKKYNIFQVREEGLTSMALKVLANSNCKDIDTIKMIGPIREAKEGYDFELCLGSVSKNKFVRYYIQAKSQIYDYSVNGTYKGISIDQINDMESYSKEVNKEGIPLFALYKYLDINDLDLEQYYNSFTDFDKESMGITITTTSKMKSAINNQISFSELHKSGMFPVFRHPYFKYNPGEIEKHLINVQAAIPFHDLAYFTIEMAEEYNKKKKAQNKFKSAKFFFFFFADYLLELFPENGGLIPIIKSSKEQLIQDFLVRNERNTDRSYKPQAIIIINTDKDLEKLD